MNELVLVVDDEVEIVKLARDYLLRAGFRVLNAGDGVTALAMARHIAAVDPELVRQPCLPAGRVPLLHVLHEGEGPRLQWRREAGEQFIGATNVTTGANCTNTFHVTFNANPVGPFITATAEGPKHLQITKRGAYFYLSLAGDGEQLHHGARSGLGLRLRKRFYRSLLSAS